MLKISLAFNHTLLHTTSGKMFADEIKNAILSGDAGRSQNFQHNRSGICRFDLLLLDHTTVIF